MALALLLAGGVALAAATTTFTNSSAIQIEKGIRVKATVSAVLGALLALLISTAAFGADAARFEAESMSESSSSIFVVNDNGTPALRFVNTGASATKSVSFSANAQTVQIRVRGVDTQGSTRTLPNVRVAVDGAQVLSQRVSGSHSVLSAATSVGAGPHTVSVNMTNRDTGENIYVDWVAFTYQAPSTDSLSITDFGATPNDTTDDTGAINRAISAARSQGIGVFVPAGTFRHGPFTLDGVRMHGTGDTSLLYAPQPSAATINLRGGGPELKDLKVQTPSNTRIVNQDAVRTARATNFLIQNVTVDGSNAAGIIMGVSGPGKVLNNRVINTKADAIHMTDATHDIVVDGNYVRNAGDDMIAVVSYRHQPVPMSYNVLIQNNDVDGGAARGITVVGGRDVTIQNNTIGHTPHGAGVYLAAEEPFNTYAAQNILVRNNTLNVNDGAPEYHGAILAVGYQGYGPNNLIHIDNNTVNNPFAYGVKLEGDNQNVAVTNNKMYNVPHVPIHIVGSPANVYCAGNAVNNSPHTKNCGGTFNFTVTGSTLMYP
jgi:hypothetical protein